MVRICALPAAVPDELRAKTLLMRTLLPCDPAGNLHAGADPAEALAWSLAGDLLRNGGMAETSPEGGITGGAA